MSVTVLFGLCLVSAFFYMLAAVVMKLWTGTPFVLLVVPVCLALGTAAWFESMALPGARMGIVLVLILACEAMLGAGVAVALGESYGRRELFGLASILLGVAILYNGEGRVPETP